MSEIKVGDRVQIDATQTVWGQADKERLHGKVGVVGEPLAESIVGPAFKLVVIDGVDHHIQEQHLTVVGREPFKVGQRVKVIGSNGNANAAHYVGQEVTVKAPLVNGEAHLLTVTDDGKDMHYRECDLEPVAEREGADLEDKPEDTTDYAAIIERVLAYVHDAAIENEWCDYYDTGMLEKFGIEVPEREKRWEVTILLNREIDLDDYINAYEVFGKGVDPHVSNNYERRFYAEVVATISAIDEPENDIVEKWLESEGYQYTDFEITSTEEA